MNDLDALTEEKDQTFSRNQNRRRALTALLCATFLAIRIPAAFGQPPPPPRRGAVVYRSTLLPRSADFVNQLQVNVDLNRSQAVAIERILSENLSQQTRILKQFGINPDNDFQNVTLTSRDARELNKTLDMVIKTTETEADRVLSGGDMSEFRDLLREHASARRTAVNSLRR
ncbi:MAG: hypothetical protein AAF358_01690 [Pseudomonadota bacterium]